MKIKHVIILIILTLGSFGVIKAKQYYDDRYVGTYYYLKVPSNQDTTLDNLYSSTGEVMSKGKEYNLIAYNELGEEKEVIFSIRTDEEALLLQPNIYLEVKASNQTVLGEQIISKEDVPIEALEYIEKNHK